MKICTNTNNYCLFAGCLQPFENFCKDKKTKDGLSHRCKSCSKQYRNMHLDDIKEWYEKNFDYVKSYQSLNRQKIKEYRKMYYLQNKEKEKKQNKQYKLSHREEINKNKRQRIKEDINYKIACNLRVRLNSVIRGNFKVGSAIAGLMMSIADFKIYLEERFYSNPKTGEMMTWENYGPKGWHIDHVVPLSAFDLTDSEQLAKACHYTNLQPMWCFENISKSNKIFNKDTEMYGK